MDVKKIYELMGGSLYSAQYMAVLNRASSLGYATPSDAVKSAQDIFVRSLVSNGIFAKLDILKVMATDGCASFSDLNWISPSSFKSSRRNPQFTPLGGLVNNGGDSYVDIGWAPSNGINYQLNNCEHIIYYKNIFNNFTVNAADGTRTNGTTNQSVLNPQNSSITVNARTNSDNLSTVSDAQFDLSDGLYFWGRTSSSSEFVKKGSGSRITNATNSDSLSAFNFFIGALNQGGSPFAGTYNLRTVLIFASGGLLTTTDENNFKNAWDAYLSTINSIVVPTIGTIYNKSSWSNLNDFVNNGSTSSVDINNTILFSGGTGSFTQSLDLANATKLAKWSISASVKIGSKNTTSYGFGFGIRSINGSDKEDCLGQFEMDTFGATGQLVLYAGTSHTSVGTQYGSNISFSVGDIIAVTVSLNETVLTMTARNVTTSSATTTKIYTYSSSTPYYPNTGRFSIFSIGGIFNVNSLTITSTEAYRPKLAIVGDSKTQMYFASYFYKSFGYQVQDVYGPVAVLGGGSDRSAEYVARINDIALILPKYVLIAGISNDIRTSVPSATWQSNVNSFISSCQALGCIVVFSDGLYETSISQAPVTTWANANIPSLVWNTNTTVLGLNADNTHPNDSGHTTFASMILTSGKFT